MKPTEYALDQQGWQERPFMARKHLLQELEEQGYELVKRDEVPSWMIGSTYTISLGGQGHLPVTLYRIVKEEDN